MPLTRRWLLPAAVCSLAACLALTAVSFWESFALRWGREAVGVTGGVAVFYRSGATPQPLSLVHARWTGAGNIPGAVLLGFHFLHDPSRRVTTLLIGVPMWFPTTLSLAALLVAVRARRRRSAPQGFDLGAAGGPGRMTPPHAAAAPQPRDNPLPAPVPAHGGAGGD